LAHRDNTTHTVYTQNQTLTLNRWTERRHRRSVSFQKYIEAHVTRKISGLSQALLSPCTQAQKEVRGVRAAAGERVQCAFDSVVNGCSHGPLASEGVLRYGLTSYSTACLQTGSFTVRTTSFLEFAKAFQAQQAHDTRRENGRWTGQDYFAVL
jgi:hypothetical protein